MVGQPVRGLVWLVAGAVSLAACNLVSGAADVTFDDDDSGSGSGAASTGPGSGGGGGSSSTGVATNVAPADGVTIESVSLYQGIRRPLMEAGQPAISSVPIVTGRDGLLRIFYSALPEMTGQAVIARLTLGDAEPIDVQTAVGGVSQESDLDSTLNISVPGDLLAKGSFRVDVLMPQSATSGTNLAATYPSDGGQQPLSVQSAGTSLKIVLVPVRYDADGSGRLPDTSPAQIQRYRDRFYRLYPIPEVDVQVTAPLPWSSTISPTGSGWNSLLNAMYNYRQQSGAAPNEYYYGIFAAASSFAQFCGGGCVAGLSLLAGPNDPMQRVGIGMGFSGDGSTETAAHEVGHEHGRGHAPCQTSQGLDPGFPYSDGSIGEWGYDLVDQVMVSPQIKDLMSYCDPTWVSDYNFINLFNRMRLVNNADLSVPETSTPTVHERISIGPDGVSWDTPLTIDRPLTGELVTVTVDGPNGSQQLTGHFYPYSHLEGGVLLFPSSSSLVTKAAFSLDGQKIQLPR